MIIRYNNESDTILPDNYCEIDYIEKIVAILEQECDDSYELYVIYDQFNEKTIVENDLIKIAIHVGNETKADKHLYAKFSLIFRFYLSEICDYVKVFPISIGYNCSGAQNKGIQFKSGKRLSDRKTDVFFIGQPTKRRTFIKALKGLKGENYNITITDGFRKGLQINEYLMALAESKICLVPKGISPETFRYTEALASGCIVVTTERVDAWFYKNSPAYFLKSWKQLTDEFIRGILNSDLDGKYQENLKYYQEYLSPEANANYILAVIKNPSSFSSPQKKSNGWSKLRDLFRI